MEQVGPRRPRVSIARVMRWIACAAISLAVLRRDVPFLVFAVAPLCWAVLAYDLSSALFPQFSVQRPPHAPLLVADRPVRYPVGLWAMADGQPVQVELVPCRSEPDGIAHAPEVTDRYVDGRDYLCLSAAEPPEPLEIGGQE